MAFLIQGSTTAAPGVATNAWVGFNSVRDSAWNSTEQNSKSFFLGSAVIKNLTVNVAVAPGVGQSRVYTLYKNGSSTGMTVTIADLNTSASIATVAVSVASGDYITLNHTSSATPIAPTRTDFAVLCETVDNYYMMTGGKNDNLLTDGTREYTFPWGSKEASAAWSSTLDSTKEWYFSHSATITDFFVNLSGTPGGAGKSYTFTIYKNGVQEASSAAVISNTDTTATVTGLSIAIADGDRISVSYVAAGTPTARLADFAIKLVPAIKGESGCSGTVLTPSTAVDTYYRHHWNGTGGGTTETNSLITFPVGIDTYLYNFRTIATVAPGAGGSGKKRTQAWRKNGSSDAVSIEIAETATTGSSSSIVKYAGGDTIAVKTTPTSTPAAANIITYATMFIMPQSKPIIS